MTESQKTEDHVPGEPWPRRMLTEKQVLAIIPVARSTLWRLEGTGKFPKGVYIGARRKFWYEDEIAAWQAAVDGKFPRCRRPYRKNPKPG